MSATLDLKSLLPNRILIGDQYLSSASGGEFDHVNPATGKAQRTLALAGPEEIDLAVKTARAAFLEWRKWHPTERRRVLLKFAALIAENREELASVQSLEAGITRWLHAPQAVDMGVAYLEDAACWADRLYGDTVAPGAGQLFNYTVLEPIGVVGVIQSWNGSVAAFAFSAAPALAAGCTVVLKPSELAPFGPLRCAELALQAGIPPGVINVVPGSAAAGEALVSHPGIDKVTFTGSPPTGRKIAAACALALKPCLLELGGKSARLVFDDANFHTAIDTVAKVAINAGQQCTLGSRLLVHARVYDQFADQLGAALDAIKVGDPFDKDTMMGPVINAAGFERIRGLIDRAQGYGNVRVGGKRFTGALADGFFIPPTLVDGIDNQSEIARTEVFGPVFAMIPFTDDDEAIAMANDSEFGLAAYVMTRDVGRAHRVASLLNAGNIGINGGFAPAGPSIPFGGRKISGWGKQGGLPGIMEYVHTKAVQLTLE